MLFQVSVYVLTDLRPNVQEVKPHEQTAKQRKLSKKVYTSINTAVMYKQTYTVCIEVNTVLLYTAVQDYGLISNYSEFINALFKSRYISLIHFQYLLFILCL